jgi:hypothetical protein
MIHLLEARVESILVRLDEAKPPELGSGRRRLLLVSTMEDVGA